MRVILTLDLPDAEVREANPDSESNGIAVDIREALLAQLDALHLGPDHLPVVPQRVRVAVGDWAAVDLLLDAANVGLEDLDEEDQPAAEEAWEVLRDLTTDPDHPTCAVCGGSFSAQEWRAGFRKHDLCA